MKKMLFLPLLFLASGCSIAFPLQKTERLTCSYEGKTYQAEETFAKTGDECNICTCQKDGSVSCTENECNPNPAQCKVASDCEALDLDQSFCDAGEWTCQQNQCEFFCDIGGRLAP